MNTEKKKDSRRGHRFFWAGPVLLAIPFAGLLIFAVIRWGTLLKNLIHVVIKMVVIS